MVNRAFIYMHFSVSTTGEDEAGEELATGADSMQRRIVATDSAKS